MEIGIWSMWVIFLDRKFNSEKCIFWFIWNKKIEIQKLSASMSVDFFQTYYKKVRKKMMGSFDGCNVWSEKSDKNRMFIEGFVQTIFNKSGTMFKNTLLGARPVYCTLLIFSVRNMQWFIDNGYILVGFSLVCSSDENIWMWRKRKWRWDVPVWNYVLYNCAAKWRPACKQGPSGNRKYNEVLHEAMSAIVRSLQEYELKVLDAIFRKWLSISTLRYLDMLLCYSSW